MSSLAYSPARKLSPTSSNSFITQNGWLQPSEGLNRLSDISLHYSSSYHLISSACSLTPHSQTSFILLCPSGLCRTHQPRTTNPIYIILVKKNNEGTQLTRRGVPQKQHVRWPGHLPTALTKRGPFPSRDGESGFGSHLRNYLHDLKPPCLY
jgi:hypothetical protein